MEDESQQYGLMEVVPYDSSREIVLRHDNAVVVYDPASQQLALRSYNADNNLDHTFCPTCRRPFALHDGTINSDSTGEPSPGIQSGFRNPEYFRMVQQSLQTTGDSAAPPSSPRRRLVQPARAPSERIASPASPVLPSVGSSPAPSESSHGISSSAFSQNFLQKVFVVKKELGRGGRGVVFLVEHVLDGVPLGFHACKRIPVGDDHQWLEKVLMEVQLLSRLHHQNLVAYQHVWLEQSQITNFGPPVPCAYILQEYCNGGDLQNYVTGNAQSTVTTEQLKDRMRRRSKGDMEPIDRKNGIRTLQFDEIYSFFRDMTAGIQFLHANGFIHRDLKPSNCLLHRTNQGLRVLVSDFGEVQEQKAARRSTGTTGTVSYCAPEVLRRIRPDGPLGNFSFKSDIFSLGMILYFICFASLPYSSANILNEENEDLDSLRAEVLQWTGFDAERRIRPELPEELYIFLKRLLAARPEDRPTADEVSNGIRTRSSLGEPKVPRPSRTGAQNFEELTPRRRIVPLDSPMSTPPPMSPMPTTDGKSSAIARVRPSALRQSALAESISESQSIESAIQTGSDPYRGLVLHRLYPSPTIPDSRSPERQTQQSHEDDNSLTGDAYLLTNGDSTRTTLRFRLLLALHSPALWRFSNVLLVSLKIASILQPCTYRGINPRITYPLILLALWDFGTGIGSASGVDGTRRMTVTNLAFSTLTLIVHCIVLGVSLRLDCLCSSSTPSLLPATAVEWNAPRNVN